MRVENSNTLYKLCKTATDEGRWRMIIANPSLASIGLDNDETYAVFEGFDNDDPCVRFDQSIGDMPGIASLLEAVGVKWECV